MVTAPSTSILQLRVCPSNQPASSQVRQSDLSVTTLPVTHSITFILKSGLGVRMRAQLIPRQFCRAAWLLVPAPGHLLLLDLLLRVHWPMHCAAVCWKARFERPSKVDSVMRIG